MNMKKKKLSERKLEIEASIWGGIARCEILCFLCGPNRIEDEIDFLL